MGALKSNLGAGVLFLPKLAEFTEGNLTFATGIMVLLMAATIVCKPIVLSLLRLSTFCLAR